MNYLKRILPLVAVCLALSVGRVILTGNFNNWFLVTNLILAIIPYLISLQFAKLKGGLLIVITLLWILFLPNAFYVVTDLIHLNPGRVEQEGLVGAGNTYNNSDSITILYDAVMIFSYSAVSFLFGLESIKNFKKSVLKNYKQSIKLTALGVLYFACGFAIYLGRYVRFYSWDLIVKPFSIVNESLNIFLDPSSNIFQWQLIIIFTAVIAVSDYVYSGIKGK